jgi:hypothetical protein
MLRVVLPQCRGANKVERVPIDGDDNSVLILKF